MKNVFVLAAVVSLLFSCEKDVYRNIPKSEKPLLKTNDTVVFIDRENQMADTFLINLTDDYEVFDKRYYLERIYYGYQIIGTPISFKNILVQQGDATSISIDGNYFPTYGNMDTISVTINGINYQTVFVKHTVNFPDSIPNTVYYTYKNGIIKYSFPDGRYYELNSKIH
jgi:hypothetical protein